MSAPSPFWMVYGDGQYAPTVKHDSREKAETEAKRLARINAGIKFFVLQTISMAEKPDVTFVRLTRGARDIDDEIPF